ncbi:hypothetical protein GGI26_000909 [Coemansia sp. RSA 1358]|uniref:Uncharacterized protein n=1 Tax=Coemansia umbellata TaxID=1424467 RepID=A0ABQ8PUA7_9FUNG|nr:hypothetical protein BX070DRAFT_248823 [Coemansia spiralis]KAJ1995562.1 hypothetical protein EDC05_000800 [Coemansia umbellata]KAJ2625106.1 hypothetical protein GGI26_000909 [Coemansia sp. RSA 1358]
MIASNIASAIAFAAIASAQAAMPASPNERNIVPGADRDRAYLTVTQPNIVQPAPIIAAPQTVVQNAATDEPTVTVTHTNGAASFGMSAAVLIGTFFAASYF